ncbi:MAG: hypothetical protein ABI759_24200 [Candidatus Solibacter sp.]
MLVGLILALYWLWLLVVPLAMALQAVQVRGEAKVLRGKFGQAYLDYRKPTWF